VKLFGGTNNFSTKKVGLLYGLFNFAFGTNFLPSYVDKVDLIDYHLMTIIEYLDVREQGSNDILGASFLRCH
jgi:hypothetical protein